jgi:hypothetical protein
MSASRDSMQRLERANPYPVPDGVRETSWAAELLAGIVAHGDPGGTAPAKRRRWIGRRGVVLALAATLLVGAGAGLAAIAIDREAPAPTQVSVRQALDLPGPERGALRPVPGGIREAFRAQTPYGTWVINTIQTRARGTLITSGVLQADGSLLSMAIRGCRTTGADSIPAIAFCGSGTGPLGVGAKPEIEIVGRVAPQVAGVELRLSDGTVVRGYSDRGFFVVLLDEAPPAGDLRLVARDESGTMLGGQTLWTPPGVPPVPVQSSGP